MNSNQVPEQQFYDELDHSSNHSLAFFRSLP